jgi:3-deoxy-manno-octulosonate cytidylyltransferase (CMP-KDO synthetase)
MKIIGLIPSRYASTRFHAKPLVDIKGKSMIQRVYEQVRKAQSVSKVVVATDHREIFDHVLAFGGDVCMTKESHVSGTDRCYEALKQQAGKFDYVINIQGDEPFIQPSQLEKLMSCFNNPETQIATLVKPIKANNDLFNPNYVKVVLDKNFRALYFSRSPIPYIRSKDNSTWSDQHTYFKHLGIYAYRTSVLQEITKLPQSSLELAESLEQLRWLENGYRIMAETTEVESISVDTPEDLDKLNQINFTD